MKIEFDLLSNAIDSIDHAIELVAWRDERPEPRRLKQAILAVAHGVELLLKERLKRIHPALLWESVDKYPNLNARTVTTEGAIARLSNIGGIHFEKQDVELVRSLRVTRNAIEHHLWTTTKQEADAIVGYALEFALRFSKEELEYEFFGYRTRKDDSFHALLGSNGALASAIARRFEAQQEDSEPASDKCEHCNAKAVDPFTGACRVCGHWHAVAGFDNDIPL
jgi:hypothetical protein